MRLPLDFPRAIGSMSLGYFLTKNKLYLGIAFPEYALQLQGYPYRCAPGIPDVLENYKKSSPMVKYSNNHMKRFYIGNLDYTAEDSGSKCNKQDIIKKITFTATTYKNRWGWNFDTMPNDLTVEINPDGNDLVWLWRYGFAIAEVPKCYFFGEDDPCHRNPEITLHQFMIIETPPYGIVNTVAPHHYIGKYRSDPGRY